MTQTTRTVPLFIDARPTETSVLDDVVQGLLGEPKSLPPKLFYDQEGSRLFDAICELEEYYPTRTEIGIMQDNIEEISEFLGAGTAIIEYGSGSSLKTEILLSALVKPRAYLPLDISREHLLGSAARIAERHPEMEVLPVLADYTQEIPELAAFASEQKTVVYFPGSTIGNFEPGDAQAFLERVARIVGPGGGLLIGVDLVKDSKRLVSAYDDASGVTAAFNLNVLHHINARLGNVFVPEAYRHEAQWNPGASRIEMHLRASEDQHIRVNGSVFDLPAGDSIVTEHSYKYTLASFKALATRAGFRTRRVWTDSNCLFSVHYLVAGEATRTSQS